MKYPQDFITKVQEAKRESRYVEFKEDTNIQSSEQWCDFVKEIVAMANSGGGAILFGIANDGKPLGAETSHILNIDTAIITDKIAKYTGEQFSEFEFKEIIRFHVSVPGLIINKASYPMPFTKPGTYDIGGGKQKTAFSQGSVYFRHGAKSEPGLTIDFRLFVDRKVEEIRKSWLSGVRRVVKAPQGHIVTVSPPDVRVTSNPLAMPIRIVNNQDAPTYRLETPDDTHPFRQKDVIKQFNQKVTEKRINSYDIQCVKRVHNLQSKPEFCYNPKFSSSQFSKVLVNWLVSEYRKNSLFFENAREKGKMPHKRRGAS